MERWTWENAASPELGLDEMMQELLETQLALGQSISSTSQFLRFALTLANENLAGIRSQFETIRDLALEIEKWEQAL